MVHLIRVKKSNDQYFKTEGARSFVVRPTAYIGQVPSASSLAGPGEIEGTVGQTSSSVFKHGFTGCTSTRLNGQMINLVAQKYSSIMHVKIFSPHSEYIDGSGFHCLPSMIMT